jgi:hypothetical protein
MVAANYLFRGVLVPPGKSVVEFKYQPRSFQIGAGISLGALAILAGLGLHERRRRRKAVDGQAARTYFSRQIIVLSERSGLAPRRSSWTSLGRCARSFPEFSRNETNENAKPHVFCTHASR